MDAQAKWHRGGSGGGVVRRPGATSALRTATNSSRTSTATTHQRMALIGTQRASNQATERLVNGSKNTLTEPEASTSRWREMRQSIRAKDTLETAENRPVNAKIADLCPEDREKVAKMVRRIVERDVVVLMMFWFIVELVQVGTLHEEAEKEFQRQKEVLQAEVKELRQQVRQDAEEIKELSDGLRSARRKAETFEERVLVLEEGIDSETRARLEAEQTLDLLKLEVDKLRALVQRQQDEMQRKSKEQHERFKAELELMKEEVKDAQERLLKERNERVLDKQKALDQRLERSAAAGEEKLDRLHSLLVQQQQEMQLKAKEQQEDMLLKIREQQERYDTETNKLKQELQTAQNQLQQERENRASEKKRAVAEAIPSFAEAPLVKRTAAPEIQTASPGEQVAASPDVQGATDERRDPFTTDMQSDLAIFEEVKDLYAEDLFASRRWGGTLNPNAAADAVRPTGQFDSAWLLNNQDPSPPGNTSISLAPTLSTQELSVQEAIERDMEALLRSESLHTLNTLQ
ncbi:Nucleoprotein TPR [Phytophthora palmivora]|uniref:Nucleoprotein TPR n=1 Tax=Phytophthora palmivora TaxID=4796 RepID=A0A2P4Y972_9STRA|nr:Nucleoprotein TPR [Phytophthora palmivora]